MIEHLTVIDFFCGAGGFSEGFRMAGFDVIMGIDNWQPAIATHNANHGLNDSVRDVLDFKSINEILKLPNSDVIIGSPPCVLFSLSNHGGNANKDLGMQLIRAFYRVIAVKKHQKNSTLKAWLMENVPNSINYVRPFYTFRDLNLEEWAVVEGKDPDSVAIRARDNGHILSSNEYGSAQTRKRFVCGEITKTSKFPQPNKAVRTDITLEHLFKNFPKPMGIKYNAASKVQDPNYPDQKLAIVDIHDHFYDTGVYEIEWKKAQDAKQHHPYMGIMSFPENIHKPSRTIMATRSVSAREAILYKSELNRTGNGEYRAPTIREVATVMGFPLIYQFYGTESTKWRQIGNAVCVQLSLALASKVKELLDTKLPEPEEPNKNLSDIIFLDNPEKKVFDKPPKRNPAALFRAHPVKSGNLTVDLINRVGGDNDDWAIVAHAGTGRGYSSTVITRKHQSAARKLLLGEYSEFINKIDSDPSIHRYSQAELNRQNKEYGYVSNDSCHPYNVIQRISCHITSSIQDKDMPISVENSALREIKANLPISQAMSIYAMGILINGN